MGLRKFVIVRTKDAGVHAGYTDNVVLSDASIQLSDAVRIWRWKGANTLHELSLYGAAEEYTRISEPVKTITLLGVIEIIECTPIAETNLQNSRWG